MLVSTNRVGSFVLKFNDDFLNQSTSQYRHLKTIILDAIDRMIMQSDFRDIYYGVKLQQFIADKQGSVMGIFLIQVREASYKNNKIKFIYFYFYFKLSENSEESRLESIFRKHLRKSNYSIGGTELYMAKESLNSLKIQGKLPLIKLIDL